MWTVDWWLVLRAGDLRLGNREEGIYIYSDLFTDAILIYARPKIWLASNERLWQNYPQCLLPISPAI